MKSDSVRILLMTSRKRLEVLDALADMEGMDRDEAVNDAIFHWAQDRVDDSMEQRLRKIFSEEKAK